MSMSDLNRAHNQKYDGKKEMYDKFAQQTDGQQEH